MDTGTVGAENLTNQIWTDGSDGAKKDDEERKSAHAAEEVMDMERIPRPYLSIHVGDDADNFHENRPLNPGETPASPSSVSSRKEVTTPPASKMSDRSAQNWPFTSPSSCRSNQSRSSQIEFAEADQTI